MKKTIIAAAFALMATATVSAQTQVMNIYKTDGTKITYKVANVDSVRFEEITEEDPEPVLQNQYAYNGEATDIKSVVVSPSLGEYAGYTVAVFAEEGVTDFETADPLLSIFVPAAYVGQEIDLADGTALVQDNNHDLEQPAGTLTLSFDEEHENVTVSLTMTEGDSEAAAQDIRVEYSGAFAITYQTSDELVITSADDEELIDKFISSVLRQKAADGTTSYGLGDANASSADGFSKGSYGVVFSVSADKQEDIIDLATEKDSYTLKLIDYKANTVETGVVSGTIATSEKDGKVYLYLNATMESGMNVSFDYFEEVTDVDDLSPMVPASDAE